MDDELQRPFFPESGDEPRKPDWKQEWQGMPEFIQEKQRPYAALVIRCATAEDLADLGRLLDQKLTARTKSIWHPARSHWGNNGRSRYVDESLSDLHRVEGKVEESPDK